MQLFPEIVGLKDQFSALRLQPSLKAVIPAFKDVPG